MEIWYINLRKSLEIQTLDIMRHIACLVFNPIMVKGYAAFFNCMAVVQVSDGSDVKLKIVG